MSPTSNEPTTGYGTPGYSGTGSHIGEPSRMERVNEMTGMGETCGLDNRIWLGIAAGAAIGIGLMLSRRRPANRWDRARHIARQVDANQDDFKEVGRDMLDRIRVIYEEGRKVADEAQHLWLRGRKLVRS
jgi:hypothetical protein